MPLIRTLKPNVTREEAIRHFSDGLFSTAVQLFRGPVRSVAELYIPFRAFQVRIRSAGREQNQIFALDAVRGVLDLYQLPATPEEQQFLSLETRNVLPLRIDSSQARDRLIEKVRRMVFTRGFFRVRNLTIEATPVSSDFCVPYWICFRGSKEGLRLGVLDAVRRRPEGAKVRQLVEEWLRPQ